MSLKWVCETERRDKWPGVVQDNFGKNLTRQTWEEHLELGKHLYRGTSVYYEFPPIADSKITKQTRFDPKYASVPIITDPGLFRSLFSKFKKSEFHMYTHFSYIELAPSAFTTGA